MPDDPPAALRGWALLRDGHTAAAAQALRVAVAQHPDDAASWSNLGAALRRQDLLAEAIACQRRAIAIRPNLAEAWAELGEAARLAGESVEAIAALRRAVALGHGDADLHDRLGVLLLQARDYDAAGASLRQALAMDPAHASALAHLGLVLLRLRRLEAADGALRAALTLAPDLAWAWSDLALVGLARGDAAGAVACCERALALVPGDSEALARRAYAEVARGDLAAARASLRAACTEVDATPARRWAVAQRWLMLDDYEAGWSGYELRWQLADAPHRPPWLTGREWRGETPVAGQRVLVYGEQGAGDVLQFARYVPLLAARGAVVELAVSAALAPLLATLEGATAVRSGPGPTCDLRCPVASLPLAFSTTLATIPAAVPYLRAPDDRRVRWRGRRPATDRLRIGVAWSGNPAQATDADRSMTLAQFRLLLDSGLAQFHLLQTQVRADDAPLLAGMPCLIDWRADIADFADTAVLVEAMDLVITTDTSLAHLAGALGRPVWVLLTLAPDWRWGLGRSDCPWYPTARLFRQTALGDWDGVMARVIVALQAQQA